MSRAAIVDNTILANFLDAGKSELLNKTRNIFSNFFIPERVLSEFLDVPHPFFMVRQQFATGIRLDSGFYRLCNTFDQIVMGMLTTQDGVHPGEAEAIAQAVKRNVYILLTDDQDCKEYMNKNYSYIRCYGTPFLIAVLDLNEFLAHPDQIWRDIHARHGFKRKDVEEGYLQAFAFIGLTPDKKFIANKCRNFVK